MDSQSDIQKLLRLKRHEIPPAGFHENFLEEFRHRQRVDLLRRTLKPSIRRVLIERVGVFLPSLRIPSLAYASIATIGIMASVIIWTFSPSPSPRGTSKQSSFGVSTSSNSPDFNAISATLPVEIPSQRAVGTLPPSYILESQPASYNLPLGF